LGIAWQEINIIKTNNIKIVYILCLGKKKKLHKRKALVLAVYE